MNKDSSIYAVLTGDLVGSRQLAGDQVEALFQNLNDLWGQFAERHAGAVIGRIEVFRGDGWQAALAQPSLAVKAALFLRAVVKAQPFDQVVDTRVGIGIGRVDVLKPDRLNESNGPAFQLSGEALEALTKGGCCWCLRRQWPEPCLLDAVGLAMMDLAVQRWTRPEAAAAMGSLLGWKQEVIAEHPLSAKKNGTAPTRQAVSDTLGRIGWKSHWLPSLEAIEKSFGVGE
jgi:hypothetical protein